MGDGIFISYRRADSQGWSGRIYDQLWPVFGKERVFFDLDSLYPGSDWDEAIDQTVEQCAVVVLVVGPHWSTIEDDRGNRRLHLDGDKHAYEVATALASGKAVIPVTVDGAQMPDMEDLPDRLQRLTKKQAFTLTPAAYAHEVKVLVELLERAIARAGGAGDSAVQHPFNQAAAGLERVATDAAPEDDEPADEDFGAPWALAWMDDALWVSEEIAPGVHRIDPSGGAALTVRLDTMAGGAVAVTPGRVWASSADAGTVHEIDTASGEVRSTYRVGSGWVDLAAGSGSVWAATGEDGEVVRLDAAGGGETARLDLGADADRITAGYGAVWVGSLDACALYRIDPETVAVTDVIELDGQPDSLAIGYGAVWVGFGGDEVLIGLDPDTFEVTHSRDLGVEIGTVAAAYGALWVASQEAEQLLRVSPSSLAVTATLDVAVSAADSGAVVAGAGAIWVADYNGPVHRLDPDTMGITGACALPRVERPPGSDEGEGEAPVAADGPSLREFTDVVVTAEAVWLANYGRDTVTCLDGSTEEVLSVIPVPGADRLVTDGATVWASSGVDGTVRQIDVAGGVVARLHVGAEVVGLAVNADAVWATERWTSTVRRLSKDLEGVEASIDVAGGVWAIAAGPGSVWVSNDESTVTRIDPRTDSVVAVVEVGANPYGIAVDRDAVWVANYDDGTVSRIDPTTNRVTATVAVGDGPIGVTSHESGVWVCNEDSATVCVIDPMTDEVLDTVGAGVSPCAVAIGHGQVFVADAGAFAYVSWPLDR